MEQTVDVPPTAFQHRDGLLWMGTGALWFGGGCCRVHEMHGVDIRILHDSPVFRARFAPGKNSGFEREFGTQAQCLEMDFQSAAFRTAILRTPFRLGKKNRTSNSKMFYICPVEKWQGFLQKLGCNSRGRFYLDVNQMKSARESFGQEYAFSDKGLRIKQWMYSVPVNEKPSIPAFGVTWWEELFSESVKKYFGMEQVVHVADADTCPELVIKSFADVVK